MIRLDGTVKSRGAPHCAGLAQSPVASPHSHRIPTPTGRLAEPFEEAQKEPLDSALCTGFSFTPFLLPHNKCSNVTLPIFPWLSRTPKHILCLMEETVNS